MGNRILPIYSVNYDFLPTSVFRYKVLWVTTKYPPNVLHIGDYVKLKSIRPELTFPDIILQIEDIEGERVVLTPVLRTKFMMRDGGSPRTYGANTNDFGDTLAAFVPFEPQRITGPSWVPLDHSGQWGYSTRDGRFPPGIGRDWHYGRGDPVAYIQY